MTKLARGFCAKPVITKVSELVLTYAQCELDAWRKGDRSLIPSFVEVDESFANQRAYRFGEMLALGHYHETAGWLGFSAYALGTQYPQSERRKGGRCKVEEIIPRRRLRKLRSMREPSGYTRYGGGEPDLFLYKSPGAYKFAEVKKQRDRLSETQLRCIAQIMRVLSCEVDIVYLRERLQKYTPKVYCFDLHSLDGWMAAERG